MKILRFPLARLFIGFLAGLLLFRALPIGTAVVFTSLMLCLAGLFASAFYGKKHPAIKTLFGCLVFVAAILIGISTGLIHKENSNPNHYSNQITDYGKVHQLDLLVTEKLKGTAKNNRYIAQVKFVDGHHSYGKVLLNIRKTSTLKFSIGNRLSVQGFVLKNKNPLNPNLFDYGSYLENQEIYAQVFAKKGKIGQYEWSLIAFFCNFRDGIISHLEQSGIAKEELNVLNALILGQQQDISSETLKDYQYAGAVHVLSVSGLHVGFIMLFLGFVLKPIGNSRKGSLLKLCIIVIMLWAFAVLTGLSPSIVRSATMFSFVAIGLHLRRTVNIYHTLLVSMLLILLCKPSFLFDVGFQLSYVALFFILWLQPTLSGIWQPKNKIIKYFWDIVTVSFAAQIGAMPLSIYYFHQFPGLFFLTNLLILPLLGVIMAVGVIAIIIALFGTVPFFIAKSIEWLIFLLNSIIHWVASMEVFVIRNISFSREMLVGSYLVIVLTFLWIKKPKFRLLASAAVSIILLQSVFVIQKRETVSQKEFIIFSTRKNTIIAERIGRLVTVYSNDIILKNLENNLTIQSYLVGNFCRLNKKKPLQNLMYFNGRKILIIDSCCVYPKNTRPDVLVIIQSPKLNLKRLLETYKPRQVVADASNFKNYIRLWEATCRKEKIPFHNINEKGFYKI